MNVRQITVAAAAVAAVIFSVAGSAPASAQGDFRLTCFGGGGGMVGTISADGSIYVTFTPTAVGTAIAPPAPGECGFADRGFREGEPSLLLGQGDPALVHILVDMIIRSSVTTLTVIDNAQGAYVITGLGP